MPSMQRRRDPLEGMTPDLFDGFMRLPPRVRRAYLEFRDERTNRRGAHRDQLEAFVAGYYARPHRSRQAA